MTDYLKAIILDQFLASLSMLEECVFSCPDDHWEGQIGTAEFWRVAYHTLFFVDMYLSVDETTFNPQDFHHEGAHDLCQGESSNKTDTLSGVVYSKDRIKRYINHCRAKISATISKETQTSLEKPSGFPWYPMSRGEHHLTSIRHIQHHTGQLNAYLRRNTGRGVDWTGKLNQ